LDSEQVRKLASIYHKVKGLEYEAKRVRDLAEEIRLAEAQGHAPNDLNSLRGLKHLWNRYSLVQKDREEKLRKKIVELLKEKWW